MDLQQNRGIEKLSWRGDIYLKEGTESSVATVDEICADDMIEEEIIRMDSGKNAKLVLGFSFAMVCLAWTFAAGLHWRNDGLWFQGDAPRHAANGLFWKDFIQSGSMDPKTYALQYYARYPVINPTSYPPLFYLLEGTVFSTGLVTPYASKALVLMFSLMAGIYTMIWIRRWIGPEAGLMAPLLLLAPGFVRWSNAVMLNVPATALSLAAIYHARRWVEAKTKNTFHGLLAALFFVLASMTYFPSGILAGGVVISWIIVFRKWRLLWDWKNLCIGAGAAILLLPWVYVAFRYAPLHVEMLKSGFETRMLKSGFDFYALKLHGLLGGGICLFALSGVILGFALRRYRREALWAVVVLVSSYLALWFLAEKDERYALLLCFPIIVFCSISYSFFTAWIRNHIEPRVAFRCAMIVALILFVCQSWVAASTLVPHIDGIRSVVSYIEEVAPNEPVFYDGSYDGIFSFYMQSNDPDYRRRIVLGAKLLYANAINDDWRYRSYVNSVTDVINLLKSGGGARWIVVTVSEKPGKAPAASLLRKALSKPEFQRIRSFPVSAPGLKSIDVYFLKSEVSPVDEVELPFPILGDAVKFKVRPITR